MTVKEPVGKHIFFIGMPRSGTSIIQEALSRHESLGWLSNYTAHFPSLPELTVAHRFFVGMQGQRSQGQALAFYNKLLPRPSESYPVWERIFGDKFLFSCLEDVVPTEDEARRARTYVARLIGAQGKTRFCAKLTGPPRISFLTKIFQGACFVDIVRDPRAVVASLMVDRDQFWSSKGGKVAPFWDCCYDPENMALWEQSGRMPAVLAALQWAHMQNLARNEVSASGARYLRIRYEDYVDSPVKTIEQVINFCDLPKSARVQGWVENIAYSSANRKFLDVLSAAEIEWIERLAGSHMDEFGYVGTTKKSTGK